VDWIVGLGLFSWSSSANDPFGGLCRDWQSAANVSSPENAKKLQTLVICRPVKGGEIEKDSYNIQLMNSI
jgi:hypothetical protein